MSLYRCTKCDVIENTALGGYWEQQINAHEAGEPLKPVCSQCFTGTWHGQFPRRGITNEYVEDARGFLWKPDQAAKLEHLGPFKAVTL
jgi:hypothetical protein